MRRYGQMIARRMGVRLAIGFGAVATVIIAVRLAWGWEAQRRLEQVEQAISKLKSDGVQSTQVSPVVARAMALVKEFEWPPGLREGYGTEMRPLMGTAMDFPLGAEAREALLRSMRNHEVVIAELREMRAKSDPIEWGDGVQDDSSSLNAMQRAAVLMLLTAQLETDRGNSGRAMEYLEQAGFLARLLEQGPMVRHHYFAGLIRMVEGDAAEAMEWRITISKTGGADTGPAAPEQVRRVIASLANDGVFVRQFETTCIDQLKMPDPGAAARIEAAGWWLRPLLEDEYARERQRELEFLEYARAGSFQQATAVRRRDEQNSSNLKQIVFMASGAGNDQYAVLAVHYRALVGCRASALLLAAQLYRVEREEFPTEASELTPDFVPYVPVDPYSPQGEAMRLRAESSGGVTVWSVGANGVDDGGTISGPTGPFRRGDQPDFVFGAAWRNARAAWLRGR